MHLLFGTSIVKIYFYFNYISILRRKLPGSLVLLKTMLSIVIFSEIFYLMNDLKRISECGYIN